jgi:primosomal replication protein N
VPVNLLNLTARIVEVDAMRYTPAGVPALNLSLEHESQQLELQQQRVVKAVIKALAFGVLAERLSKQALGSEWSFSGFIASARNAKHLVFHIQEFNSY